ncbi:sensor histidine kinase [uncultured Hymenobacter sp.]|uniref:sensor histidine kinase n=1 Tax=uncultured Hymenobacter sp. TaxID=170016 RepID=UPI0035CB89D2
MVSPSPFPAYSNVFSTMPPAAPGQRGKSWLRWRWIGIGTVGTVLALAWPRVAVSGAAGGTLPGWQQWLIAVAMAAVYCHGNLLLRSGLRRRLTAHDQTAWRLLLQAPLSIVFVAGFAVVHAGLLVLLSQSASSFEPTYWKALGSGLLASFFIILLYESGHFFYELRISLARSAELERAGAISQLEALRQQVDPHFLFNNLNSLAALIGDNPRAQDFLGSLANVYRYVLLSKANVTVPLSQEMAFVEAYLRLHYVRFRDGIEVVQELAPETLHLHVPPLAVQMLLENALKHNAISSHTPLRITLRAGEGVLSVTNTVHRKTILEKSTKQGLQNIVNQFGLLTTRPVTIEHRGGEFEVTLPLLPTP